MPKKKVFENIVQEETEDSGMRKCIKCEKEEYAPSLSKNVPFVCTDCEIENFGNIDEEEEDYGDLEEE
jgi:acetyl-CoA carboxylase beta subunit